MFYVEPQLSRKNLRALNTYRHDDGSYRFRKDDAFGNLYTTIMAVWAFGGSSLLSAEERNITLQYIQKEEWFEKLPGLDEQWFWIRYQLGEKDRRYLPSAEEEQALVQRLLKRCGLKDGQCSNGWKNSSMPKRSVPGNFTFHGRPWAIALLSSLCVKDNISQQAELKKVLTWLIKREQLMMTEVVKAEHFALCEHVIAVSEFEKYRMLSLSK